LLGSQALAALTTGILAVLVLADLIAIWSIFALAFCLGSAQALGQPSRQALVPALVPSDRLMNAIVLNTLVQNGSFVIGPAIAGFLLATVDFGGTFVTQVVLLCAGIPWLLAMRTPPADRAQGRAHGFAALREGLRHVGQSPFIRSLFLVTAFTGIFFVGTYQALIPIFADDVLDVGEVGFGALNAAFGLGTFAGSLFIATRGDLPRKGEALLRSLFVGSAVLAGFALSQWFYVSFVLMLAWGACAAFFMNLTITLIQSHTPDHLMGRVMAVQALAFFGMSPLGNLLAGSIAEVASAQLAALVGAAAVGLLTASFLVRREDLVEAT
jgi:MFS family permease